jgi:hypothetical protein
VNDALLSAHFRFADDEGADAQCSQHKGRFRGLIVRS